MYVMYRRQIHISADFSICFAKWNFDEINYKDTSVAGLIISHFCRKSKSYDISKANNLRRITNHSVQLQNRYRYKSSAERHFFYYQTHRNRVADDFKYNCSTNWNQDCCYRVSGVLAYRNTYSTSKKKKKNQGRLVYSTKIKLQSRKRDQDVQTRSRHRENWNIYLYKKTTTTT